MNRADRKRIMNEIVEAQNALSMLAYYVQRGKNPPVGMLLGQAEIARSFCARAAACVMDVQRKASCECDKNENPFEDLCDYSCAEDFTTRYLDKKRYGQEDDESGV